MAFAEFFIAEFTLWSFFLRYYCIRQEGRNSSREGFYVLSSWDGGTHWCESY